MRIEVTHRVNPVIVIFLVALIIVFIAGGFAGVMSPMWALIPLGLLITVKLLVMWLSRRYKHIYEAALARQLRNML